MIFDIVNDQVVINENVLLIPCLKKIKDKYEDYIPALTYVYYMTSPSSPYKNIPELEKSEKIHSEYPGDYSPLDKEITEALSWLEEKYLTPTRRFYLSNKAALEKLGQYLDSVILDDSKETGNIGHVLRMVEKCGKVMEEFKKLEKQNDEEARKTRTKTKIAYDLM